MCDSLVVLLMDTVAVIPGLVVRRLLLPVPLVNVLALAPSPETGIEKEREKEEIDPEAEKKTAEKDLDPLRDRIQEREEDKTTGRSLSTAYHTSPQHCLVTFVTLPFNFFILSGDRTT